MNIIQDKERMTSESEYNNYVINVYGWTTFDCANFIR